METINLSKKQFVIYMAVAFGLAWILEMIASVFSNNDRDRHEFCAIFLTALYGIFALPAMHFSAHWADDYGWLCFNRSAV